MKYLLLVSVIFFYSCGESSSGGKKEDESKITKIAIGTGEKVSSSNFDLKLNVGKVTSVENLKSDNHNLKVGVSTTEQR